MIAATDTRPSQDDSRSRTCSTGNDTDAIAPSPANWSAIRRLRRATTRAPSCSDRPPATTAAAISPCECPTTASGRTPSDSQTAAKETITANDTGWTTSTRSSDGASSAWRITSSSDHSTNGSNAAAHSAIRPAKTGDSSSRAAPIPAHWAP
ncbi:hypothetical protein Amac_038360 [Acrocarpospora macrocephala]|uniref:Uncharacterized protein n=1 Tax=Acrocarpospora macrocephala TaxID=150177 RepID=A0A5M3WPX2_9ACTN|nr:hypothetical protein Amac_038360 [Acrocarpospora macrocephala]